MIVILTCSTSNKLFALMSLCCQTTEQNKMETDHLIQTKTDSKLFISNQMVRPNVCILFLILYICPYVQNLSHKQIIKHNVQQAGMNQNEILHLLNEVWILQHIENKFFPKILPQNYALRRVVSSAFSTGPDGLHQKLAVRAVLLNSLWP